MPDKVPEINIDESSHEVVPTLWERFRDGIIGAGLTGGFLLIVSIWVWPPTTGGRQFLGYLGLSGIPRLVLITVLSIGFVSGFIKGKEYHDRTMKRISDWKFW